jgi:hypothetical protein
MTESFEEWAARRRAHLAYRKSGEGWQHVRRANNDRYRRQRETRIGL